MNERMKKHCVLNVAYFIIFLGFKSLIPVHGMMQMSLMDIKSNNDAYQ